MRGKQFSKRFSMQVEINNVRIFNEYRQGQGGRKGLLLAEVFRVGFVEAELLGAYANSFRHKVYPSYGPKIDANTHTPLKHFNIVLNKQKKATQTQKKTS